MTSAVGSEAQDRYRCTDRDGPGGQRCQLLIEHNTPHTARIGGTLWAWSDGAEETLPHSPYPWFVSFPGTRISDSYPNSLRARSHRREVVAVAASPVASDVSRDHSPVGAVTNGAGFVLAATLAAQVTPAVVGGFGMPFVANVEPA